MAMSSVQHYLIRIDLDDVQREVYFTRVRQIKLSDWLKANYSCSRKSNTIV